MERYLLRMMVVLALWLAVASVASAQTAVEYIHTDALGTPVAVTNSAGVVIERSLYEPYGQLINRPLTDGPGFTGHVQDAATGLTYMQQRYYDPICGCFLSVDPVTAYDEPVNYFNRYRYAGNNPYRFTDPDGRCWIFCDFLPAPIEGRTNPYAPIAGADRGDAKFMTVVAAPAVAGAAAAAAPVVATAILTRPEVIVAAGEVAAGATGVTGTAGALAGRVSQVHNALDPIAASMRTTAGLQTTQGARVFGGGAIRDLTPAQRNLLGAGEIAAKAPGAHAEATVLGHAAQNGLTPKVMEVSRTICPACQQLIESSGGRVVSPQRAEW